MIENVIDFHVHVYPPEIINNSEIISKHEQYFNLLTHNKVHKWATIEDIIARMEREKIERSVIFGFAFRDIKLCKICNDYVIEGMKKYPDKLTGLCVVPPLDEGAEREIFRCADSGVSGVGELFPEGQRIDIADKTQTKHFAGILKEAGLFVLWHAAEPVGHNYVGKGNVGPKEAASFCCNNPEITTIFAHLGGGLWLYELMPEMKKILANAYYDLAALPLLYSGKILETIQSAGVIDKFLFGTDFPILDSSRYEKIFKSSSLNRETLERIKYSNGKNLLSRTKDIRN